MLKDQIVNSVADFYLSSDDFNGLPGKQLLKFAPHEKVAKALRELIGSGSLLLLHPQFDVNIHILRVGAPPTKSQLEKAAEFQVACLYPTSLILVEKVASDLYRLEPYKRELALGNPQLSYRPFDLSILEFYRNDPRYSYTNDDIRGSISYNGEDWDIETEHSDHILLQTFGFCYDTEYNRGVAVFLRYLADLSSEHQLIWKAKELDGDYKLHPDYYENTILGNWGRKLGLLEAFLLELEVINQMAIAIQGIKFFLNDFGNKERPREFSLLVRPTLKEFNDFVLLLDKMLSENINRKFFSGELELDRNIERNDGRVVVQQKGTVALLEEWLAKYFIPNDPGPVDEMIAIFKKIRKMRQKPAHHIDQNRFDQEYFKEQRELVLQVYQGVRTLRLILANHPSARAVEVPDLLYKGEIWAY